MEMILGAMVLAGLIMSAYRAGSDARELRRKAAEAGQWDWLDRDADRREARRQARRDAWAGIRRARHRQAGGDGQYRPGAAAYFGDVYHGWWEDQLAKREAKRAARGPYVYDPDRPKWRDRAARWLTPRLDRADAVIRDRVQRARESRLAQRVADHPLVRPVGEPRTATPEPAPDPWAHSVPIADPEQTVRVSQVNGVGPAGRRHTDGVLVYSDDPHDPTGVRDCPACGGQGVIDGGVCPSCLARQERRNADAAGRQQPTPDTDKDQTETPTNDNGGTTMTAPTGEATTYEMHKADLAAQRQQWQAQLDLAQATAAAVEQAKAALNAQQENARATAAAAQAKADSLAGAGVDGETQGHAAVQAEAIDVNRLNDQYDALEGMSADAAAQAAAAEAGLASVDAEEATIDAKYGDAHNTVAQELGGDPSYLNSGGGGSAGSGGSGGGQSGDGWGPDGGGVRFGGSNGGGGAQSSHTRIGRLTAEDVTSADSQPAGSR